MKRPRFDSAPMRTSSRDETMLSGGEDAIIIGRFPTGHAAVRGIRLTTLPARSLAAMRSLSAAISGRTCGFGTLSNHSDQLPEPGSCTIHMPDRSRASLSCAWTPAGASSAAAMTHAMERIDVIGVSWSGIQRKRKQRVAGGDQHVLAAVDHVGLGRVRHLADRRVPQRVAVGGIVGDEVAVRIAAEEELARRRQQPLAASIGDRPVLVLP